MVTNAALPDNIALVMSGGGARAAYQVGFLRCLASEYPELGIPIITGISAGAINAAFLANRPGKFADNIEALARIWSDITPEKIFRVDSPSLIMNTLNWIYHLMASPIAKPSKVRGLVNTQPLRDFLDQHLKPVEGQLTGVETKLNTGELKALAISTTNYMTGQTITWTQGCELQNWERTNQVGQKTWMTVEHIMASAAIPIFFPAVKVNNQWHGDGVIRLHAPLSPAIHLGADRIIAISTRYQRHRKEADRPLIVNYPPPAQIAGILMNAVFLDLLDLDADRLAQTNQLLQKIPPQNRGGRRIIKLFALRPSQDLGKISGQFEPKLPRVFRSFMRRQGTRETSSPDWLSMVMFQPDYLRFLIDLGEKDARAKRTEIEDFLT